MLYGLIEDGNIKDKYTIKKKKYKIEKITFEDISEVFRVSNHKQYERSFLKRGFDYPKERKNEGIIHRLPTSYLTNKIIEIGDGNLDKDKEVKKWYESFPPGLPCFTKNLNIRNPNGQKG